MHIRKQRAVRGGYAAKSKDRKVEPGRLQLRPQTRSPQSAKRSARRARMPVSHSAPKSQSAQLMKHGIRRKVKKPKPRTRNINPTHALADPKRREPRAMNRSCGRSHNKSYRKPSTRLGLNGKEPSRVEGGSSPYTSDDLKAELAQRSS